MDTQTLLYPNFETCIECGYFEPCEICEAIRLELAVRAKKPKEPKIPPKKQAIELPRAPKKNIAQTPKGSKRKTGFDSIAKQGDKYMFYVECGLPLALMGIILATGSRFTKDLNHPILYIICASYYGRFTHKSLRYAICVGRGYRVYFDTAYHEGKWSLWYYIGRSVLSAIVCCKASICLLKILWRQWVG